MPRHDVTVAAPPDAVYAIVADGTRRPAWLPELRDTSGVPDRLLTTGDRFSGHSQLLGHRFVGESEVVDAVEGDHFAERVVIGARVVTEWRFEALDGGRATRVVHRMEVEFPEGVLGRIERWVLARRLDRLQREALRRLAALATGDERRQR